MCQEFEIFRKFLDKRKRKKFTKFYTLYIHSYMKCLNSYEKLKNSLLIKLLEINPIRILYIMRNFMFILIIIYLSYFY